MQPPEIIETQRLRLRQPRMEDADTIFQSYTQDPEVVKYLTWRPHKNIEETRAFLGGILKRAENSTKFPYAIERKSDGQLLGMLEIRLDGHMADAGYVLAKAYWGKGYMTEALKAVVDRSLDQVAIYRFWSLCDVANPASARVMEKAGLKREGILLRRIIHPNISDEPRDVYCYSIVK